MRTTTFIVICCSTAALFTACGRADRLPIGQEVTVQFDRSALGSARELPVSPTTVSINDSTTMLRGKLLRADSEWIQMETPASEQGGREIKTFWIPRSKILLIEAKRIREK